MVTAGGAARAAAQLLSLTALAGCAEILDIPSTSTLELAPSGPWRCLNAPVEPVVPTGSSATVRFQACDFISSCTMPVTGLRARLCDKLDIGCNNPRVADIRDRDGLLEVIVPMGQRGFDGYLEVSSALAPCFDTVAFGNAAQGLLCQLVPDCDPTAPTEACNVPVYSPIMWFFNPPVVADIEQPISLQLYPTAALPLVLDAAGGEIVAGTGSVFMTVIDCDGKPASGVTLEIAEAEDEARSLYFDSGVLSNIPSQTDSSGLGGFVRISPGFVTITGYNSEGVSVAKVGVHVNATFTALTVLAPSPVL